jgi:hypothetical protein
VAHWTQSSGERRGAGGDCADVDRPWHPAAILQESGQLGTRFSDAIMNHGAGGLGPALAMAVLLCSRSPGRSLIVLAIFALSRSSRYVP